MDFEPLIDVSSEKSVAEVVRDDVSDFIGEKKVGNLTSLIYIAKKESPIVDGASIESLQNDVIDGLAIGQRIDSRCPTTFTLRIVPRCEGYITVDGRIDSRFVDDESKARSAAVGHEVVHNLQEEIGVVGWDNNPEALPNLVEFLFTTGGSRLGMFRGLYEKSFDEHTENQYRLAMQSIRRAFKDESGAPSDDGYREIRKKVKAMTDDEKIQMIKEMISKFDSKSSH